MKNIGIASKKLYWNTLKEDEPRLIYTYYNMRMGELSRMRALIKKNTFEGARLLERGLLLKGGR